MALSPRHVEASLPAGRPSAALAPVHHAIHRPASLVPHPAPGAHAPAGQHLVLSLARQAADGQYETLALNPGDDPIRDLKMKLTNRGWFSGKSTLVFGDRELADAVRGSDLVTASGQANNPEYLHVFMKLSEVESCVIRTLKRELSLSNPAMAEQQLAASLMKAAGSSSNLLALPGIPGQEQPEAATPISARVEASEGSSSSSSAVPVFSEPDDSAANAAQDAFDSAAADRSSHGRAVVHLCIHKSAKVNWHHVCDNRFELSISISSSDTVETLMAKIEAANGMALEPGAVLIDGQPLATGQPLAAYGIAKGLTRLELVPHEPEGDDAEALPDGSPSLASPAHQLHRHWQAAREGLAEGLAPTLAKAGTGGSYFLQDVRGRPVAVFKPEDEEPHAVNNPKGRTPGSSSDGSASSGSAAASAASSGSEGLRRGTKPGEGAVREVAAYVLDHGHFAGVPPTALVSAHVSDGSAAVKVGSLQQFVEADGDCEERGYSGFPVHEVHKIAVLDLRLGNADRNAGNILARRATDEAGRETWQLTPIDHGYILPASFEDLAFEWMYWPQAEQPFSEETLAYIAALDVERDIATLAAHGITLRPECERTFRVCTLVLQKGAAAGLTPAQIASILCREGWTRSVIEKLHTNALQLCRAGSAGSLAQLPAVGASRAPSGALERAGGGYMGRLDALLTEYLEDYVLECADLLM